MQTITLELPQSLFDHVKQRAQRSQRSLEKELYALIVDGLSITRENGSWPIYDEIIDLIAGGATPDELANFRLSPDAQARAHELLERNREGVLSARDSAELDHFTQIEHMLGLIKVRAQQAVARRQ